MNNFDSLSINQLSNIDSGKRYRCVKGIIAGGLILSGGNLAVGAGGALSGAASI